MILNIKFNNESITALDKTNKCIEEITELLENKDISESDINKINKLLRINIRILVMILKTGIISKN
jgi:hypothetical protein